MLAFLGQWVHEFGNSGPGYQIQSILEQIEQVILATFHGGLSDVGQLVLDMVETGVQVPSYFPSAEQLGEDLSSLTTL